MRPSPTLALLLGGWRNSMSQTQNLWSPVFSSAGAAVNSLALASSYACLASPFSLIWALTFLLRRQLPVPPLQTNLTLETWRIYSARSQGVCLVQPAKKGSWLGPGGPPSTLTAWTGLKKQYPHLVEGWFLARTDSTDYFMLINK